MLGDNKAPKSNNEIDVNRSKLKAMRRKAAISKYGPKKIYLPLIIYRIEDILINLRSNPYIRDSALMLIASLAVFIALPFYPYVLIPFIVLALAALSLLSPFISLFALLIAILPAVAYQVPGLLWLYIILMSISLFFGYMHYRTMIVSLGLIGLAFSQLGYILFIPFLMISYLNLGLKRSIYLSIITIVSIAIIQYASSIKNSAYLLFNSNNATVNETYYQFNKPDLGIFRFGSEIIIAEKNTYATSNIVDNIFSIAFDAIYKNALYIGEYLLVFIIIAAIVDYIASYRGKFVSTKASLAFLIFPVTYIVTYANTTSLDSINLLEIGSIASFLVGFISVYVLENFGFNVSHILDIKKQDARLKFGISYEELAKGQIKEKFDDIADYTEVKKELYDSVIGPIEQRDISRAYNVEPTKGILLYGPPGTGKTLLMRALANEIRAAFYYIKASDIISQYAGVGEKTIDMIFSIAKRNAPCIIFIDEIDAIARSRDDPASANTYSLLTQLLTEMDGFEANKGIIVVGATNVPQVLDKAILRPGRFSKIIYVPPPDIEARKAIFSYYLSKLPVAPDINIDELAAKSERYTAADIKELCESVAQQKAQQASREHKILTITQSDLLEAMKNIKPSVTLSMLEAYESFRLELERTLYKKQPVEQNTGPTLDDVVGLEDAKKAIKNAIEVPLLYQSLVAKYDVKQATGILLFGPPGNGKSMLIKAIANESKGNINVIEITGSTLLSNGTEAALSILREIFYKAIENKPSIIVIDEIDTLTPSRDEVTQDQAKVVGELLRLIDKINSTTGVVIVGITNRPEKLDPAMLRPGRFDKLIYVRPPNANERAELFKRYLSKTSLDPNIDYDYLARITSGYTGSDIANICREVKENALQEAIRSGGKDVIITQADIEAVIRKIKPSAPQDIISKYLEFLARYGQR
ncbi:MAG: hypothetical protein ARM1_0067 [Candidatus Micrarchaeota archaeon]|nr:MAG: hypothetical protein ARM1_0067 [Candidatus Micrarchaeota archaeon]